MPGDFSEFTMIPVSLQLCCTKYGREFLRANNTYLVLRELHKWEADPEAKKACEDVVHILISDEPESGADNIEELEGQGATGTSQQH